ncbi:hypothetical protein F5Y13DRAFT_192814 [Hypoxylon sp. FL1857]|nr:hypothetical protein F5Y13DRAFT_192814 [Hypoxylon sp. FL1857]
MTTIQDNVPAATAERRQHVVQYCAKLLGETEDQIADLVLECKEMSIKYLIEKKKVGPNVGLDYFQWRIDFTLWTIVSDSKEGDPFPYSGDKMPDYKAEPFSAEYNDAYQRLVEPVPSPAREEQSRGLEFPMIPDLSQLSLGGDQPPRREQEEPVPSAQPSKGKSVVSTRPPAPRSHPQPPSSATAKAGPSTSRKAQSQPTSSSSAAEHPPEVPNKDYYIWPATEAQQAWKKTYHGRNTYRELSPFCVAFPPERSHQECIVKRISRSNELVNSQFVHIVWVSAKNKSGHHVGWKIVLSPVSKTVKTDDVLFLQAITIAWDMMTMWYNELLTTNQDVNFATLIEECMRKNLADRASEECIKEGNREVQRHDDIILRQIRSVVAAKNAAKSKSLQLEREAASHILKLLRQSSSFEDRKENLQRWVSDTTRHPHVGHRRELAKQVWTDNYKSLSDDVPAIDAWFWSVRDTKEPTPHPMGKSAPTPTPNPFGVAAPQKGSPQNSENLAGDFGFQDTWSYGVDGEQSRLKSSYYD